MCASAATWFAVFNTRLAKLISKWQPPWPNGQGVGLLIRRLWVRVPQGVFFYVHTCDGQEDLEIKI